MRASRHGIVSTLQAGKPAFHPADHRSEVVAQNAVGAAHDLLSHLTLTLSQSFIIPWQVMQFCAQGTASRRFTLTS
jgi:hypothetical protein